MWGCIAAGQYLITIFLSYADTPAALQFADLCTLANCSIIFFTENYRGYYIHGKAPWQTSDLPLTHLKRQLDSDMENKNKARAFGSQGGGGNQLNKFESNTFEIFVAPKFKQLYDSWKNERELVAQAKESIAKMKEDKK